MTADAFVPITSLPDLRAGDLLLLKMRGDAPEQRPYPLYMISADRATWCHDERRSDEDGFTLERWQYGCEVARLRGVERADLADDRWPETERRLRAAVAAPTTIRVTIGGENPPAPKIGDVLTAEQVAALPVGAVVTGYREGIVCIHADAGWQNVCVDNGRAVPLVEAVDPVARTRPEAGKLLGLGVHFGPTRADVARALAAQGYEPAAKALRTVGLDAAPKPEPAPSAVKAGAPEVKTAPPLKPGDRVVGRWAELPPGSVVDARDDSEYPLAVKRADGLWNAWYGLEMLPNVDEWTDDDGTDCDDAGWCEEYVDAVLVGHVTEGAEGEQFVKELAALGYAPAVERAREIDAAKQPTREPLKVGDRVPADRLAELPVGAVVLQDSDDEHFVHVRVPSGWRCEAVVQAYCPDDRTFLTTGSTRSPNPTARRLVGLGCTATTRLEWTRQLAACGHEPAREWLRQHDAQPPAIEAPKLQPGDFVTDWVLPVGSVVRVDSTSYPLVVRCGRGWTWERAGRAPSWSSGMFADDRIAARLAGDVRPEECERRYLGHATPGGSEADWRREVAAMLEAERSRGEPRPLTDAVEAPKPAAPAIVRLRDVPPGTLALTADGGWVYRLPNGNGWNLGGTGHSLYWRQRVVTGTSNGWTWPGEDHEVVRQIPAQPADLAPGAWERLIGEAPPLPVPKPEPQVGDVYMRWCDVPPGAVVADRGGDLALVRADGHSWLRIGGHWSTRWVGFDNHSEPHPGLRVVALGPLDCTIEHARALTSGPTNLAPSPAIEPAPPPLPEPGAVLTQADLDRLPVGAVVDSRDGTPVPWAVRLEHVWMWLSEYTLKGKGLDPALNLPDAVRHNDACVVALTAPLDVPALRAWCAARGYEPAIRAERELTAPAAGPVSPALDAGAPPVDDEDMATQSTITLPNGITITAKAGESDSDFAVRAAGIQQALTARDQAAPVAQQPRIGVLDTILSWGKGAAGEGARALVNQRALAAVDAGRVAGAQALAAGAEALLGESAAVAVLRTAQHPAAPAVVDGVVSVAAALLGADNLSRLTRARLVERVVSRGGEALVEGGVGAVVTQVKRTIHAIGAAAAAAELPEQTTAAEDATPAT